MSTLVTGIQESCVVSTWGWNRAGPCGTVT